VFAAAFVLEELLLVLWVGEVLVVELLVDLHAITIAENKRNATAAFFPRLLFLLGLLRWNENGAPIYPCTYFLVNEKSSAIVAALLAFGNARAEQNTHAWVASRRRYRRHVYRFCL
jgi:hypothetical protein